MEHERVLTSLTEFRGQETTAAADLSGRNTGLGKRPISAKAISLTLIPLDALVVLLAAFAAHEATLADGATFLRYAAVTAFGTLLAINLFSVVGVYTSRGLRTPMATAGKQALAWGVALAMIIGVGVLSGIAGDYSQAWTLAWFVIGAAGLLGLRALVSFLTSHLRREGRLGRRVALLGDPALMRRLARHFKSDPDQGVYIAGVYSDELENDGGRQVHDGDFDGGVDALIAKLREEPVEAVLLAPSQRGEQQLRDLRRRLSEVPADVWLCPGGSALNLLGAGVSHFAGVPALNVMERPISRWRSAVKEIEDRILAAGIVLMISPLLIGIAIAIKFDSPGPLLFKQKRRGYNNRTIEVLKFRTMAVDKTDDNGDRLTERNDPRVTKVGAFLRRWSLDELPQFLNVLRGDMSIVGPRPHALGAKAGGQLYFDAVPYYDARHRVKPGITGLAQISGWRGPTETVTQIRKRVEYDVYYIEHWSLWLDLKIIFLTAFKGFKSENAF